LEKQNNQPVQATPEDHARQLAERRAHHLALLEAALYVAGRPLDLNELCQVLGSRSKKRAKFYADTLMNEYASRSSAIEVLALKDDRYVLQVKAEFTPLIKKLVNRPLLSSGPLKTLSYIAYRQPISQKKVIEVRGQHAYGHVKLLKDMGLIMSERLGRSLALRTTDYFADYFGLTTDTALMKKDLKKIFGDALKENLLERQQREQQKAEPESLEE
jgi:segregation and condensation protein B